MASMFWGLKLEPGKRYSTTVDKSFHISMATLDTASVTNDHEVVSVALEEGGRGDVFFLTNLRKKDILSVQLDLNFMTGDRITLFCKGQGIVHLSGYMTLEDEDELSNAMIDDEAEEEEEEDEDEEAADEAEEEFMNSVKGIGNKKGKEVAAISQKRKQQEVESNKKSKKKKLEIPKGKPKDDSDESDDEDGDINDLIVDVDSDAEMEEEETEGEDNDEDDEDEEDEEEEEEKPKLKTQKQKNQQLQQQQNQKNKTPNKGQQQQQQQQQGKKQQKPQTPRTPNGVASPNQKQNQFDKKDDTRKQNAEKSPGKQQNQNQKQQGNESVLTGGVRVKDIRQGNGPVCKPGKMASVYYTGRLKSNGKVFDSVNQGSGFKFRVGQGEVIKGWDTGVAGMKVGGKRIITCPPQSAYGAKGAPPQIPANSTLVFEVELKGVN